MKEHIVIGVEPGMVVWRGKDVDLRTISDETAENLIKEGFPFLKKEKPTAAPAVREEKKEKV